MRETPGRSPRRRRRLIWIVPVVALGATGVWLAARGPRVNPEDTARRRAAEATAARDTLAGVLARLSLEADPMAYVRARVGKDDSTAVSELVNAYAAWASRGDTLDARRLIVRQFLDHME